MGIYSEDYIDISGIQLPKDACVVIVRTEWNSAIVDLLEEGAKNCLENFGVPYKIVTVPGAIEIAFAIKKVWDHSMISNRPSAFIALGCVVKGDTPHFEYVCQSAVNANVQLNLSLPVPTIFGVLTVNTQVQAEERTGGIHGHKGEEAALTAVKMISISYHLNNPDSKN